MAFTHKDIREVLLFCFHRGMSVRQTLDEICSTHGARTVSLRCVEKWFARFREGRFDVDDMPRSGRPATGKKREILTLIESSPTLTIREIAKHFSIGSSSVQRYLKDAGLARRRNVWMPQKVNEVNMLQRASICDLLLLKQARAPFLEHLVTGGEKWILYECVSRRAGSTRPTIRSAIRPATKHTTRSAGRTAAAATVAGRSLLHKVVLRVWWDVRGVIHHEVLADDQPCTDAELYCRQLDRLREAIRQKRPMLSERVVFQHDSTRPYATVMTTAKLTDFRWDVLPHPPYSPDIDPSDYCLFRSLQNSLKRESLKNEQSFRKFVENFFDSKPESFFKEGILRLTRRWKSVFETGGAYVDEQL